MVAVLLPLREEAFLLHPAMVVVGLMVSGGMMIVRMPMLMMVLLLLLVAVVVLGSVRFPCQGCWTSRGQSVRWAAWGFGPWAVACGWAATTFRALLSPTASTQVCASPTAVVHQERAS